MKRTIAAMLAALLAVPGCAVRAPAGGARTSPRLDPLAIAARHVGGTRAPVARDQAGWEKYLGSLPPGTKVRVETRDGRSFKGIFLGVDNGAVLVQPRTRIPEPVRTIAVASLTFLEVDQGMSAGKVVAIAAGVAGATVLGIFLILVASLD